MLNKREIEQTRIELQKNYELLGFPVERIKADLHFTDEELTDALKITRKSPENVWKLRDYLEEKLLAQGKKSVPFTVLTHNIYYPYQRDWN